MIGLLHVDKAGVRTDTEGNTYVILKIADESKYNVKGIVRDIQQSQKDVTAVFDYRKNYRSLDQNALLWKLLTIYADAIGGGRHGDVQPEEIYYQMLNKYGVAQFIVIPKDAVDDLKALYRDIRIIDDAVVVRNGKRTPAKIVKCIVGSSQYDTSQMSQLIDGVFDELAAIGVDVHTSREVGDYYDQWQQYKEASA